MLHPELPGAKGHIASRLQDALPFLQGPAPRSPDIMNLSAGADYSIEKGFPKHDEGPPDVQKQITQTTYKT